MGKVTGLLDRVTVCYVFIKIKVQGGVINETE